MSTDVLKVMATGIEALDALDFSWCLELKSDAVHAFISCCNAQLATLNVSNCPVLTDDALGWISGALGPQGSLTQCRKLLSLDISYTKCLSDRGLAHLGQGCKALQFVNLEGLEQIGSDGVRALVSGCPSLRVLSLRKCLQLTDSALVHIGDHCRQLRSLNLCGCVRMSSSGLVAMVRGTPVLQALNLEGCLKMREDILAVVATSCLSLQVLNLNGCQEITDSGITTLVEHLPFVQRAQQYRGLEPKHDGLQLKFSIQHKTICDSAALRIQALMRGHAARKIAASWRITMIETPARRTIRKSYVRWRLSREIDRRVERTTLVNASAVTIQALVRGVQSRAALARDIVEARRLEAWSTLAVRVQAAYRGHWTRTHYYVVRKTIERYRREQALLAKDVAVVRLQRAYRARFHRSRLDDVMAINQQRRLERQNAATTLQRLFRSRAARKAYRALRAAVGAQHARVKLMVRYAVKIQSRWRGHQARQQLSQRQREKQERERRQSRAASRINAGVRGYFGRRVARDARVVAQERWYAARRIQRAYRLFKTPTAERLRFENLLVLMKTHMVAEGDAAMAKQRELLKKTRALIDQDSASEPESDGDDDWRDFQDEHGDQFWFSPSRKQRLYVRPNDNAFEKAMLGLYCRVYWPLEQQWFSGYVAKFNRVKKKHRVEYDDGDHDWLDLRTEGARIQLYNGYCWTMATMFEPALRTLRAATFLTLRFQRFDPRFMCWRSGLVKAFSEPSDHFLLLYDDNGSPNSSGEAHDEWVEVLRTENHFQVQDAVTLEWYSLSGYVFGRARGRPLNFAAVARGVSESDYYSVEDYLSYIEETASSFQVEGQEVLVVDPEMVADDSLEVGEDASTETKKAGTGSINGEEDGDSDADDEHESDEDNSDEDDDDDDSDDEEDDGGDDDEDTSEQDA